MEIILLEKVGKIGSFGDTVNVKPGYARNFLIPQNMALPATKKNKQYFDEHRQQLEQKLLAKQGDDQNRADLLSSKKIDIAVHAHDDGQLYGSINVREIVAHLTEQGIEIDKKEVILPDNTPIRQVGDYTVVIQLNDDLSVDLPVSITPIDTSSSEKSEA